MCLKASWDCSLWLSHAGVHKEIEVSKESCSAENYRHHLIDDLHEAHPPQRNAPDDGEMPLSSHDALPAAPDELRPLAIRPALVTKGFDSCKPILKESRAFGCVAQQNGRAIDQGLDLQLTRRDERATRITYIY